jgi:DNA-binding CsgD family transcriptional regulator
MLQAIVEPAPLHPVESADVMDLALALGDAVDLNDLGSKAGAAFRRHGYLGFSFVAIRRIKTVSLHTLLLTSWPAQVQGKFHQRHLFDQDPVIMRSRVAQEPFAWDLSIYDVRNQAHQALLEIREKVGVRGGVCAPVVEAFGGRSVLYLTGRDFDTSARSLLALQFMAEHMANRVNSLSLPCGESTSAQDRNFCSGGELSPRERQVFGWIAFGKSSKEIAGIMSISDHTVNDYIGSVMSKLNASNRTEAVMRALLTNQIDLS